MPLSFGLDLELGVHLDSIDFDPTLLKEISYQTQLVLTKRSKELNIMNV